jgi:hypothetical protein
LLFGFLSVQSFYFQLYPLATVYFVLSGPQALLFICLRRLQIREMNSRAEIMDLKPTEFPGKEIGDY